MLLFIGVVFCIIIIIGYFVCGMYKGNILKVKEFEEEKLMG